LTLSFSKVSATDSLTLNTLSSSSSLNFGKATSNISLALFAIANDESKRAHYSLTSHSGCESKLAAISNIS